MTDSADKFLVAGRGELHLGVLIEQMRREGYELQVSQPEVIVHRDGDKILEPYEELTIQVPETYQGAVIEELGKRRGELVSHIDHLLKTLRRRTPATQPVAGRCRGREPDRAMRIFEDAEDIVTVKAVAS